MSESSRRALDQLTNWHIEATGAPAVPASVATEIGPRPSLAEGEGYAFYDRSSKKKEPTLITVDATSTPVMRAMSEEQRANWAGLTIEARPVTIRRR